MNIKKIITMAMISLAGLVPLVSATYKSITEYNLSAGLQVPFVYANDITGGLFIKLLLVAIWLIFSIGSYFIQKRNIGSGDFPTSLAVAGFVTSVVAILLRLVPNLVDGLTLAITIIVAGISILYLLFSRD